MDLALLKEFIVLAERGNFEKAAEQLFTTQSTLSKHIKKLEAELGLTLFDRTTRNVRITESGETLLRYAREMAALEQRCLADLSACRQPQAIRIRMENVSSYPVADLKLIDAFFQFQSQYPHYKIDVASGKMYEVYQQLSNGQVDFAVFRYREATDMSGFAVMPFAEDRVVAVCARQHPLAAQSSVTLRQLQNETFLLSTKESFIHSYMLDACRVEGFTPKVIIADNHMRDTIDMAALNMGIFFCMKRPAMDYRSANVAMLDLEPAYPCQIALCCRKGKLSAPANEFWQFMNRLHHRALP